MQYCQFQALRKLRKRRIHNEPVIPTLQQKSQEWEWLWFHLFTSFWEFLCCQITVPNPSATMRARKALKLRFSAILLSGTTLNQDPQLSLYHTNPEAGAFGENNNKPTNLLEQSKKKQNQTTRYSGAINEPATLNRFIRLAMLQDPENIIFARRD